MSAISSTSENHNNSLRRTILEKFDKIDAIFAETKSIQNIILVDDDNTSNNLTKALIYRISDIANILVFKKPEDVISYLESHIFKPDLLLVDYNFNNSPLSGMELIDKLKKSYLIDYNTKSVILTAGSNVEKECECKDVDVVLKPLSTDYLKKHLNLDISRLEKF
jgi:DNA-binding LytR/AlgR family response regulator